MIVVALVWAYGVHKGLFDDPRPQLALHSRVTPFQLPDIQKPGDSLALSDLAGRGVLLNFWASWCEPCIAELPLLERLHKRYSGEHFTVVSVTDDDPANILRVLGKKRLPFPVLYDKGSRLRARFGGDGLPFTVYIGPDGKVAGARMGALTEDRASEAIERLIILARASE